MHPNAELVRREAAAWDGGDADGVAAFYTPHAICDVQGAGPLTGEYRGHDGVRDSYRKCVELLETLDELRSAEHDVIANDEHVVRLLEVTARKGEVKGEWRIIAVYHVLDGKIDRKWEHFFPAPVSDAFLTHVGELLARNG
jgi:ketosteroid isomerase-like protein